MRFIQKNSEPESLTQYKKQSGAYYDGYDKKDDVREALLKEQGYLCGYCMKRLESCDQVKIEHVVPQSKLVEDEKAALNYHIMLGDCYGNEGHPRRELTCDAHRGNDDLTVNPFSETSIGLIKYRSDGTIYSEDAEINKDLNSTLNLNYNGSGVYLKENRKEVLLACKNKLKEMKSQGCWSRKMLQRMLEEYESPGADGKLKPYSGIVVEYLKARIKRA